MATRQTRSGIGGLQVKSEASVVPSLFIPSELPGARRK